MNEHPKSCPAYKADAILITSTDAIYIADANLKATTEKTYKADAAFVYRREVDYTADANLQAIGTTQGYNADAVLYLTLPCQTPGVALLPTLVSVNLYFDGQNTPELALLPNLKTINIYSKSC